MNVKECLYLLNEKNYDKSLADFRKGFDELNIKDLRIDNNGVFYEFNEILKTDLNEIGKTIVIKTDDIELNPYEDCLIKDIEDVNDVLGFIREPEKLG